MSELLTREVALPCTECDGKGVITRECCVFEAGDLEPVRHHRLNNVDRPFPNTQGYQVYRCRHCTQLWGRRYQYNEGTGSDDHWAALDNEKPERHY